MSLIFLYIDYDELPPSSNHIYARTRFGTVLTKVAKKYAEDFSYKVIRKHLPEISQLNKNGVFSLQLRFTFKSLLNEGAFDENPKKRPTTLYKRIDLSNRIKLIEDCIRDVIGIDDSQTFTSQQLKMQDPNVGEKGRVEIIISEVMPDLYGLPPKEELDRLAAGLKKKTEKQE